MKKLITSAFLAGFVTAGASAAVIEVTSDITSDTTWTSANDYILTDIIYVKNGATLTIDPGTIIRGEPEDGSAPYTPGALVVTRNGQIDAEGTPSNPIVFITMPRLLQEPLSSMMTQSVIRYLLVPDIFLALLVINLTLEPTSIAASGAG
jgi:hypothetical protein